MKNLIDRTKIVWTIVFLIAILVGLPGCEPGGAITFNNQHNQEVKILFASVGDNGSIDGFVEQGIIPAHTKKVIHLTFLGPDWVNRIKAVDVSGKVVFLHDYKMEDLIDLGWKITIPP